MSVKNFSFLATVKCGAGLCALLATLVCWTNWQTVKADTNIGSIAVGTNPFEIAVDQATNII